MKFFYLILLVVFLITGVAYASYPNAFTELTKIKGVALNDVTVNGFDLKILSIEKLEEDNSLKVNDEITIEDPACGFHQEEMRNLYNQRAKKGAIIEGVLAEYYTAAFGGGYRCYFIKNPRVLKGIELFLVKLMIKPQGGIIISIVIITIFTLGIILGYQLTIKKRKK